MYSKKVIGSFLLEGVKASKIGIELYQKYTPTQLSAEQAYARQLANLTKPQSPAQIRAHGEVKIKLGVLWLVGTVSVVLGGFGCISFLMTPDKSKTSG